MQKILVANRGEIALRIMRTCKKMGIKTVAVFSEADRKALHVRYADEAVCLGPPPSNESYLLGNKIIDFAKALNVDGIHPGYGFLSENANFAKAVNAAGIAFIGPAIKAIETMGSKLAAKEAVSNYNIPMVPGTDTALTDIAAAQKIAKGIGFPILVKAAAGGGGKGMRIVETENEFEEAVNSAIREAENAFGDGAVFIEKYITKPRHIEIQILGDAHGNIVHLFERECSIQRRHQKVVEEAPSVVLIEELRAKMGQAAIDVAKSVNYIGAGTVEFLLDDDMNFYFLEMNTRLQVEHPVTEMITGIDLVEEQIKVARGEALSFKQEDLTITGHAMEVRIYAEDPLNNFLPSIGTLTTYKPPVGNSVRLDDSMEQGMEIPIYYDPMIGKLITYGKNRAEAIAEMLKAIKAFKLEGVETTLTFGEWLMQHPPFVNGELSTNYIKQYFSPEALQPKLTDDEALVAAVVTAQVFNS